MHLRVLVCGDRHWSDETFLWRALDENFPPSMVRKAGLTIIEGYAPGADRIAESWAKLRGHTFERYPADWKRFGKAAGPLRNTKMLVDGQPHLVIAFHDDINASKGTKNMLVQAAKFGVDGYVITHANPNPIPWPLRMIDLPRTWFQVTI